MLRVDVVVVDGEAPVEIVAVAVTVPDALAAGVRLREIPGGRGVSEAGCIWLLETLGEAVTD